MAGGSQPVPPGVAADLAAVRLVVFDFDGVFTDNTVYVSEDGTEAVRCWRGDGLGLQAVQRLGVGVMILSTEVNPVVSARARKLKVECVQGCDDKRTRLESIVRERGLTLDQVAYVGNDVNDLGCLEAVRLPVVVGDAHASVLAAARLRTLRPGGRGAVREVCDLLVAARESTQHPAGAAS
ncbi:MAG TPA: HAD hydrolase family protein [Gemmatimonadales bacterium]|nr:HAD hydrolase family protein [Gemmatimonadales bacterium]